MSSDARLDALVVSALAGDVDALVKALEEIAPRIRARISPKIPAAYQSMVDADDVMQVTYGEAYSKIRRFRAGDGDAFASWIATLAENNLIDALRSLDAAKRPGPKRRAEKPRMAEDSMAALVDLLAVTATTPSIVAMRGEAGNILVQSIEKLSPEYGTVITLYDLQGMPAAEVAKRLGKSEGAMYMLRARAHDRLREFLGKESRFFSTPS